MSDYIQQLDNILSGSGNQLLLDAGSVSHEEAMEKAETEYCKWQVNTLSPVEEAYLETIKMLGYRGKIKTNRMLHSNKIADMKSLLFKDIETYTADEIVLLLKENGVIDKNDQHLYILHNNKQIEDQEQSTRKTVNKSIFYAVASTIVSIIFAFYSLWTLIIFIPLTVASYLWVAMLSIASGLSATSGGTIFQRKMFWRIILIIN